MPDSIRYRTEHATQCPMCLHDEAGIPWGEKWFLCDMGCYCVALVATGEVFVKEPDDN